MLSLSWHFLVLFMYSKLIKSFLLLAIYQKKLSICFLYLMMVMKRMKRSSKDFGIIKFSKAFVILYVIQQNATLMWYYSHKLHALQELTVSGHHWVTAWTSWYQHLFYWNQNTIVQGGEVIDWDYSAKEEEWQGQFLLQVSTDKSLSNLHVHMNSLS